MVIMFEKTPPTTHTQESVFMDLALCSGALLYWTEFGPLNATVYNKNSIQLCAFSVVAKVCGLHGLHGSDGQVSTNF